MADTVTTGTKAEAIEHRLDAQTSHYKRATMMKVVVGIVIMVILVIYLSFLSSQLKRAIEPQEIAQYAVSEVEKRLPEAREQVSQTLTVNADQMIEDALDQLVAQIPDYRQQLEERLLTTLDQAMNQARENFTQLSDQALSNEQTRQAVSEVITMLEQNEDDQVVADRLSNLVIAQYQSSEAQQQMNSMLASLLYINQRLTHLAEGQNLTEDDQNLRELLAAVRELAARAGGQDTRVPQ